MLKGFILLLFWDLVKAGEPPPKHFFSLNSIMELLETKPPIRNTHS